MSSLCVVQYPHKRPTTKLKVNLMHGALFAAELVLPRQDAGSMEMLTPSFVLGEHPERGVGLVAGGKPVGSCRSGDGLRDVSMTAQGTGEVMHHRGVGRNGSVESVLLSRKPDPK